MEKLENIKIYGYENNVPILQDESWDFIREQILKNHCSSFLEIGTAIGYTSIRVAQLNESIHVTTIERDPEMIEQAKENIRDFNLEDRITLIEGDALEAEIKGTFDCIFIDAAKAQYERFFRKYSPLLSKHGIIISDNMNFHGLVEHPERTHNRHTKQLVRKLRAYHEFLDGLDDFTVTYYETGDGIALARRKDEKVD